MKKLYQVVLSKASERMPINETVLANNKNHALNFVLKKHGEYIDNFNITFVNEVDNIADEDTDHNDYNFEFKEDGILDTHTQIKERNLMAVEVDGQILHFDSELFEIILKHATNSLNKYKTDLIGR